MRFSVITLFVALSASTANAFVTPGAINVRQGSHSILASLAEPSAAEQNRGRSKDEIALELASGKLMEGGQVIDFSSVKGESRAEAALAKARDAVMAARKVNGSSAGETHTSTEILGINSDVISEVGHDLGTFADSKTVQGVASYLRSMAPSGFFETPEGAVTQTSFTDAEKENYNLILRKAYDESGEVTSAFAKTFYMGTQLLPVDAREAIWAIYVWCRRTDEIVDAPRENDDEMLSDLSSWEIRLENLWKSGAVEDVFDLCLLDVRIKYPNLDITPFVDMVRGMLMDVPDLGQDRYETFDELHLYCYRVAGTVGLMSMPIFGCAPGYDAEVARYVIH
jgi:phytoene synthase